MAFRLPFVKLQNHNRIDRIGAATSSVQRAIHVPFSLNRSRVVRLVRAGV